MNKIVLTNSSIETMKLGEKLSSCLPAGACLCMAGDLGAGKTTLVRGIASGLGIKDVVQSPTFNIMKIYLKGSRPLIHIDAYRLADMNTDIGLDEYIGYETGITVIEWPEFILNLIPKGSIQVTIKNLGEEKRQIIFESDNKSLLEEINL